MNTCFEISMYIPDYGWTSMETCDSMEEVQEYIKEHPCKDGEKYSVVEMECEEEEEEEEEEEPPCMGCNDMNTGECENCIHKDNTIWH